jgi:hypothetical protein
VTGLHILLHSIQMILRNLKDVLRLATVPSIIAVVVFVAVFAQFASSGPDLTSQPVFPMVAVLVVILACSLWVAVNWHRFVLLEEYPKGWFPKFRGDRVFSYLGHGLLVVLFSMLALIPAAFVAFIFVAGAGIVGVFLALIPACIAMVFIYQMSVILPAAAIGRPMRLRDAFQTMNKTFGQIFVLIIASGMLQTLLRVVSERIFLISDLAGAVFSLGVEIFLAVLQISILTTLYGHYVEGRPVTG